MRNGLDALQSTNAERLTKLAARIFLLRADSDVIESERNELSDMAGKQAKVLSTDHIDDLIFFAERSRHPLCNRLIVLLSVKAGLRAAEIAKLTWYMVLDASGEVGHTLELQDKIAKKRGGRSILSTPICEERWLKRGDAATGRAQSSDPSEVAR
jgi:hypothetical protein